MGYIDAAYSCRYCACHRVSSFRSIGYRCRSAYRLSLSACCLLPRHSCDHSRCFLLQCCLRVMPRLPLNVRSQCCLQLPSLRLPLHYRSQCCLQLSSLHLPLHYIGFGFDFGTGNAVSVRLFGWVWVLTMVRGNAVSVRLFGWVWVLTMVRVVRYG
jgi:hypothetical protein